MLACTPVNRLLCSGEKQHLQGTQPQLSRPSEIQEKTRLWIWGFQSVFLNTWKGWEPERPCVTLWCLHSLCCLHDFASNHHLAWPRDSGDSFRSHQMQGIIELHQDQTYLPKEKWILDMKSRSPEHLSMSPLASCLGQVLENSKMFWNLTKHVLSRKGLKVLYVSLALNEVTSTEKMNQIKRKRQITILKIHFHLANFLLASQFGIF